MALTREDVAAFARDGFLSPLCIASDEDAKRYRADFDALEARVGTRMAAVGLVNHHFEERFIWELATHPLLLDAAESLIGPDVLLLATHFFCKYGQDGKFVAWHQDLTYWGLDPARAITAWYAVDDSDAENGCMRVIPGSHASGIHEHGKSDREGNLLSINQEVAVSESDAARAVDVPLRAGEASFHDGALVHGSLPNLSGRRRCGLTIRYVPSHVRPATGNSLNRPWPAVLVRGNDPHHHFGERPIPFPLEPGEPAR